MGNLLFQSQGDRLLHLVELQISKNLTKQGSICLLSWICFVLLNGGNAHIICVSGIP